MRRPISMLLVIMVTIGMVGVAGGAQAQEAEVAWSEEFDSADSPVNGRIVYQDRGSGKTGEDVVILEISEGVLRYGMKYEPNRRRDRLNLMFGDRVIERAWGPFDVRRYPFVEIKWRGDVFALYYGIETAGGQRRETYAFLSVVRKETDARGKAQALHSEKRWLREG